MKERSIEVQVIRFARRTTKHMYTRRELSKAIKEELGEEAYKILQWLWKNNYLYYNAWGYINPTRKAYIDYRF